MKIFKFASLLILDTVAGALVILFFLNAFLFPPTPLPPLPHQLDPYKMNGLINDYRASKGLNKLSFNPDICLFAKKRLEQLLTDFSHHGYYAVVRKTYCKSCIYAGENIARNYSTEQETVQAWINSPDHLENILEPAYKETCIATNGYSGSNFVVQEFTSNF